MQAPAGNKIFLSTKGSLNDVGPEVKNFLAFVDGLPVKDKWIDEIQAIIPKLKHTEKEKVNYMTYQMKIAEEREEAKTEERADAIRSLIATVKALSASSAQAVEQLIKHYSLTKDEAQAAVQANW